jgi:hypothetical protein
LQWLPLPIFAAYRVLLAIYVFIWLILHIIARREQFGPHWLIFLSDLSFALLMVLTSSLAVLCVTYTIVHYHNRDRLLQYFPKMDFPIARIYKKQDNIPWFIKILWLLYNVTCSTAFLIFLGYWVILYDPCEGDEMAVTSSGLSGSGSGDTEEQCSFLDVHTIQIHGVNLVIVFLDLILSRIPYQFFHFMYAGLFTGAYIIFSLVYWGAGGENHEGQPYIYTSLDYGGRSSSIFFAIIIFLAPIVTYVILALFALLRDLVSRPISCCFRDVKKLPYREEVDYDNMNGASEETMTKV